jgi:hypothetical protein
MNNSIYSTILIIQFTPLFTWTVYAHKATYLTNRGIQLIGAPLFVYEK